MAKKNKKNIEPAVKNIFLTGFMCAGKTSAGSFLAQELGRPFRDSDALLERKTGKTIAALIKEKGLAGFRRLEAANVKRLAAGTGQVIALGGGVYPSRKWKKLLGGSGTTVFLYCPWPELEARLKAASGPRPLLAGPWEKTCERARRLYNRRLPFYRQADLTVSTAGLSPQKAAERVRGKL